jgi:hypothetical protein
MDNEDEHCMHVVLKSPVRRDPHFKAFLHQEEDAKSMSMTGLSIRFTAMDRISSHPHETHLILGMIFSVYDKEKFVLQAQWPY